MLTPGQSWIEALPPENDATGLDPAGTARSPSGGSGGPSTLAAENALLADAIRLARDHHPDDALARLDALLTLYPDSPLAETARAERSRIVEGSKAGGVDRRTRP